MKNKARTVVIDGVTFELRPNLRRPTNPEWVCLRKIPRAVKRYQAMAKRMQGCKMVEVGIDQGGSTSFYHKLYRPEKLVGFELSPEPVATLENFLAEHDPENRIRVNWGIDQSDSEAIARVVCEEFGDSPLDLVIDDASHRLAPSTSTFETLFPLLKTEGVYVIEDWSLDHQIEEAMHDEGRQDAGLRAIEEHEAKTPDAKPYKPTSILIMQLVLAAARNPRWVNGVQIFRNHCEVTRGGGEIEPGTPIDAYTGQLGARVFDPDHLNKNFSDHA